jgi:asparagine synthase (glutamine-hydrolysing)
MCGLFGALDSKTISSELSSKMLESIAFRGPDGNGICDLTTPGGPLLGHTRLAVIGGGSAAQPMWSKNGRYCLTFNGEIYNFEQLAKDFEIDHEGSDTRLLVELWGKVNSKSLPLLRGQFAFAIWDDLQKNATLVTDHFGILPLYIHEQPGSVYWASSARVFRAANLPLTLCSDTVSQLMNLRFVSAPKSVFREVSKLSPGALVEISSNRDINVKSWNNAIVNTLVAPSNGTHELTKTIRSVVSQSLRSDQEVGIFLSGGVDSAVIATLASEQSDKPVKAFTATWHASGQDSELSAAQKTSEALNIEIVPVEIDSSNWWRAFNQSIEFRESPTSEIADPVMFLLSERAAKDVKVVLSGEGVDELFYGYPKFAIENLLSKPFLGALVRVAITILSVGNSKSARLSRLKRAINAKSKSERWDAYFSTTPVAAATHIKSNKEGSEGDLSGLRDHDLQGYLPEVLLERADRMGMANALEIRPAMLNLDLLALAQTLPPQKQTRFMKTKVEFRNAASEFVGSEIAMRKSRGFPIPLAHWIKTELSSVFHDTLQSEGTSLNSHVSKATRITYLNEHLTGRRDHSLLIFTWASFILWEEFWT